MNVSQFTRRTKPKSDSFTKRRRSLRSLSSLEALRSILHSVRLSISTTIILPGVCRVLCFRNCARPAHWPMLRLRGNDLGRRSNDQNVMWGYIGCQLIKLPKAVAAMVELIDDLPESPERFAEAKNSVVNRYRVAKIKYRELPSVLRIWERRNQTPDPRKERLVTFSRLRCRLCSIFTSSILPNAPNSFLLWAIRPNLISIV